MDWNERLGWLLLGMLAGFVLGYIVRSLREIKEELDEVRDLEREIVDHHPDKKEDGWARPRLVDDIALGVVILLVAFSAFLSQKASNDVEENYKQDTIARCVTGVEQRNVQRQTVDAIYNLAIGSIKRDKSQPPLTKQELILYNRYIDRVNAFREDLYSKIKPSPLCAPYVKDDVVKPPTPPQPPLTR